MIPATRYAGRNGVDLAYKVFGEGDRDIVLAFAFISNVDVFCELPEHLEFIERLRGLGARVILFDKRGTGLSDRGGLDASVEDHADDLVAILDAAGSARATIIGWFDGGATALVAAARHPDRVEAVIAYEVLAVGRADAEFPWELDASWIASLMAGLEPSEWGRGHVVRQFWQSEGAERLVAWWERYESMSATPTAARRLAEAIVRLDVRPHLAEVRVPVLVLHDAALEAFDEAPMRWLADALPDGRLQLVHRSSALPAILPDSALVDEMEEFLTGSRSGGRRDVLTTVFTDIVGSTAALARTGDESWRSIHASHDEALRRSIARFSGTEANTTGDGIVATFPLPSSALHFAAQALDSARALGLELRVGVHSGELILRGDDLVGLAVHAAARICAAADPGRIMVSDTVRTLLLGLPFAFEPAGEHELKGVPDRWRLWYCVDGPAGAETRPS
ncbi:adenylate/guanylate cyclase domain-containing protein [Agromyces binzhouensis]|uniref:Adenylate/guanylate cyclase domain-containing protein n=1 Tax=Agromyces binzhouensis TaxID=1817495 RepID=A0A4Q2JLQ7_9MICO|nr:adenylate/guanylate cyclase domain-containing protein [Agromyces binzhouensis]RXZ47030.1 adenylate/guanylate cyclase domain-containing protein [Agromyces binzhouensis]